MPRAARAGVPCQQVGGGSLESCYLDVEGAGILRQFEQKWPSKRQRQRFSILHLEAARTHQIVNQRRFFGVVVQANSNSPLMSFYRQ